MSYNWNPGYRATVVSVTRTVLHLALRVFETFKWRVACLCWGCIISFKQSGKIGIITANKSRWLSVFQGWSLIWSPHPPVISSSPSAALLPLYHSIYSCDLWAHNSSSSLLMRVSYMSSLHQVTAVALGSLQLCSASDQWWMLMNNLMLNPNKNSSSLGMNGRGTNISLCF